MQRALFVAVLALALSGCAQPSGHARPSVTIESDPAAAEAPTGWRAIVSAADVERIEQLPALWARVLGTLPRSARAVVAHEGPLLVADAALEHPALPPGSYRCRLVRLGARTVRSFPAFFCYVGGDRPDQLSFTKQTGSELPGGWLHDDDKRLVLVGAQQQAVGDNHLAYGEVPARDLVGVVERIGPFRWRLVLPGRGNAPGLDVYELVPVPPEQQAPEPGTVH